MRKGLYTEKNVWDKAAAIKIYRGGELLDPGVNYFVLMLDQLGLPTQYSCEGHPDGFYITFNASYEQALELKKIGYFSVEIEDEDYWSLRQHFRNKDAPREKVDGMRWATEAWEKLLGPLHLEDIVVSK